MVLFNIPQILLSMLIGSMLLAGLLSAFLAFKNIERGINLSFLGISTAVILNALVSMLRLTTLELNEWILYEKWQNTAMLFMAIAYVFFVSGITKYKPKAFLIATTAIPLLLIIYNAIAPFGMAYSSIDYLGYDPEKYLYIQIVGEASYVNYIIIAYVFIIFGFSTYSIYRFYKTGSKFDVYFLIFSLGFIVFSVVFELLSILFDLQLYPLLDELGQYTFIAIVTQRNIRTIIESLQIKKEFDSNQDRMKLYLESTDDLIFDLDVPTGNVFFTDNFYKLLGYRKEEFEPRITKFLALVHSKDSQVAASSYKKMVKGNVETVDFEVRFKKSDGRYVWLRTHASVVAQDSMGKPIRIVGAQSDVTEKVRKELELKLFSKAVSQTSTSILITDKLGRIVYCNPAYEETIGYTLEEIRGLRPRIVNAGYHPKEFFANLWDTILTGSIWLGEIRNRKKNGELYWERNYISSIKDEQGEISHFIAVKVDTTEQRVLEEAILKTKEDAIQANELKSTLLMNLSHEFRTPLNGILGISEMLKEITHDDESMRLLIRILHSANRLLHTLDSALMITELENKNREVRYQKIDIKELLIVLEQKFIDAAHEKRLTLTIENQYTLSTINSDEFLLQKILTALLDNAIKFTSWGNISLNVSSCTIDKTECVQFLITDTGVGIDPKNFEIIFEDFKQLSTGYSREFEGMGLGLSLCKRMCTMIGATISLTSEKGKGSSFKVLLPQEHKLT